MLRGHFDPLHSAVDHHVRSAAVVNDPIDEGAQQVGARRSQSRTSISNSVKLSRNDWRAKIFCM